MAENEETRNEEYADLSQYVSSTTKDRDYYRKETS